MHSWATAYFMHVNSAAASRRLALVAAFAVAAAGLLPSPHAHVDRPDVIVHVHATADAALHHDDDADHDHATLDHGDHRHARPIVAAFDISNRFVLTVGAAAEAALLEVPVATRSHQPNRTAILPTHDPPLRFTSSPAPPTLV